MVRTLGKLALALGVAAILAAPARAQQRGFGMGGGMGVNLLGNQGVQKELKLSDDQVQKVTKIVENTRTKMREKFEDIPQDERREKMPAIMKELNDSARKELKDVLKADQLARLDQISLQQRGYTALMDSEVADKLKLTGDQKTKIKEMNDEAGSQIREIFQNAGDDRQAAMQKIQTLRKETNEKVMNVLSADQKSTWKEMTGTPFEVRFERRPGAGQ
jgi:Spy/CpxP family protein refolding chaperone